MCAMLPAATYLKPNDVLSLGSMPHLLEPLAVLVLVHLGLALPAHAVCIHGRCARMLQEAKECPSYWLTCFSFSSVDL